MLVFTVILEKALEISFTLPEVLFSVPGWFAYSLRTKWCLVSISQISRNFHVPWVSWLSFSGMFLKIFDRVVVANMLIYYVISFRFQVSRSTQWQIYSVSLEGPDNSGGRGEYLLSSHLAIIMLFSWFSPQKKSRG